MTDEDDCIGGGACGFCGECNGHRKRKGGAG